MMTTTVATTTRTGRDAYEAKDLEVLLIACANAEALGVTTPDPRRML